MDRFPLLWLVLIQLIWAINYVISKAVLDSIPAMLWVWLKNALASPLLIGIALLLKRPHPAFSWNFLGPLIMFSLLGSTLTQSFFVLGLAHTTAINSSILSSITPLVTLLTVAFLGFEKPNHLQILGLIISFIGILIFCRINEFQISQDTFMGDGLIIIGSICYGLYFALSKDFLTQFDPLWIAAWFCILTTFFTTIPIYDNIAILRSITLTNFIWITTIYNVVFVTILGYFLVIWAIRHQSALVIAHYEYLQPIITTALAYFCLGETLQIHGLIGAVLILIGLGLSFERKLI